MSGKLPIDRVRAAEQAAHPYEDDKQMANELAAEKRSNQPPPELLEKAREATMTARERAEEADAQRQDEGGNHG